MLPITKETRFNDLPHEIKQKLINIHKNSFHHYTTVEPVRFAKFNYLYSQTQDLQMGTLQRNLNKIVQGYEKLCTFIKENKDGVDFKYLYNNIKNALHDIKEDISMYKKCENNTNFIDEIVVTYNMLKNKYEELSREKAFE